MLYFSSILSLVVFFILFAMLAPIIGSGFGIMVAAIGAIWSFWKLSDEILFPPVEGVFNDDDFGDNRKHKPVAPKYVDCPDCHGDSFYDGEDGDEHYGICYRCGGKGKIPT